MGYSNESKAPLIGLGRSMALCEPNTDDVWAPMSSAIGQHTLQSPRTPRSRSAPPRPHGTSSEQLHKFDEEGAHQQKRKFNVHHASGSGRIMKEKALLIQEAELMMPTQLKNMDKFPTYLIVRQKEE